MKEKIQKISIPVDSSIRQAMSAIDKGALGIALLIEPDTQRFVGLVTDGDIRRALLSGHGLESPISLVPRPPSKTGHINMSAEEVSALISKPLRIMPLLNDEGQVVNLAIFDQKTRIPVSEPVLGEKELLYVSECILTGWVSSIGKFVTQFEEMFAKFCGAKYAVSTSSGTTALHLSLLALDIQPGDEVIVPSLTFIATANVVRHCGATPVFIDSEMETWNIDPSLIENAITPRTKAIIPVHLYGHPANMDPIVALAKKYDLHVIEDAAEAHGALYKGKKVGSLGEMGTFSFFGNKTITTGEGGMVVTDDESLYEKMQMIKAHGMDPKMKYIHPVLGYNYRLTNIQAAIGVAQMEKIDKIIEKKRLIAKLYENGLKNIPGITLPPEKEWARNVYWMYSILIDDSITGVLRDDLMKRLQNKGIESRPFFYPIHKQPIYDLPINLHVAEKLSRRGLSLPSASNLKKEDVEKVIGEIKCILG